MDSKKKFHRGIFKKVAKVATRNRQNRHLAEFFQSFKMKAVEHQILSGKVVSEA